MNARASIIKAWCVLATGLLGTPAAAQLGGGVARGNVDVVSPMPACPAACHRQAALAFQTCRASQASDDCADVVHGGAGCLDFGPTLQECAAVAQIVFTRCLFTNCGIEVGPPPCEQVCQTRGERSYYDCRRFGGPMDECARLGREATQLCLREECGLTGNCGPKCRQTRLHDPPGDWALRRTDPGGATLIDLGLHRPIDLLEIRLGQFAPANAGDDPFAGASAGPTDFTSSGNFVRLDIVLAGLVNPPGPNGPFGFNPYAYGDNPIYGFIEIDMDGNVWTGGELDAPEYRYLGNAVRFGGIVKRPPFADRMARNDADLDRRFVSPPFVERSGEEFHLALLGSIPHQVLDREGNGDFTFDRGETWMLTGPFFHRAHGYEPFSLADGGQFAGEYSPPCRLQFQHDLESDLTTISLVFPLNPVGAGQMRNQPPQAINHDPSDQACVLEALTDLQDSALFTGIYPTNLPEEDIIVDWAGQNPADYLDPTTWRVTALVGTSYSQRNANGTYFVWTDLYPNVRPGDVDGNGFRTLDDVRMIVDYILANDFVDGLPNRNVPVRGFAAGFTVFDVNHDGAVNRADAAFLTGDGDGNMRVDLRDFGVMQQCFGQSGQFPPCLAMNFDRDEFVDADDLRILSWILTGAYGPQNQPAGD